MRTTLGREAHNEQAVIASRTSMYYERRPTVRPFAALTTSNRAGYAPDVGRGRPPMRWPMRRQQADEHFATEEGLALYLNCFRRWYVCPTGGDGPASRSTGGSMLSYSPPDGVGQEGWVRELYIYSVLPPLPPRTGMVLLSPFCLHVRLHAPPCGRGWSDMQGQRLAVHAPNA